MAVQRYKEGFEKSLALIKKYDGEYEELIRFGRRPEINKPSCDNEIELDTKHRAAFSDFNTTSSIRECGKGWLKIIETFCSLINERNDRADSKKIYIQQIVGKLGSLHILAPGKVSEIEGWINFAERHSAKTCEVCGYPGQLIYDAGWQRTRCEAHRARSINVGGQA